LKKCWKSFKNTKKCGETRARSSKFIRTSIVRGDVCIWVALACYWGQRSLRRYILLPSQPGVFICAFAYPSDTNTLTNTHTYTQREKYTQRATQSHSLQTCSKRTIRAQHNVRNILPATYSCCLATFIDPQHVLRSFRFFTHIPSVWAGSLGYFMTPGSMHCDNCQLHCIYGSVKSIYNCAFVCVWVWVLNHLFLFCAPGISRINIVVGNAWQIGEDSHELRGIFAKRSLTLNTKAVRRC